MVKLVSKTYFVDSENNVMLKNISVDYIDVDGIEAVELIDEINTTLGEGESHTNIFKNTAALKTTYATLVDSIVD